MWSDDVVTAERDYLFGIAYRMLGSASDADDAVQQAFLRARDATGVDSPRALLTTIVTRICIDELRSARRKRETYVGPWLPEPIVTAVDGAGAVDAAESLSIAFLLLLETLSPLERAVYVLREAFDRDTTEVARALDRTDEAVRQLLSRARDKIAAGRRRRAAPPSAQQSLAAAFFAATQSGDLEGLVALLREDVALTADHGGKAKAVMRPLRGADHVARYFLGVARKGAREGITTEVRWLNGALGLAVFEGERLGTAFVFEIDEDAGGPRIARVHVTRNPDKLTRLGLALRGDLAF